jgi:hypothetical protein
MCLCSTVATALAEIPRIAKGAGGGQLIVGGKPYLILGGELAASFRV